LKVNGDIGTQYVSSYDVFPLKSICKWFIHYIFYLCYYDSSQDQTQSLVLLVVLNIWVILAGRVSELCVSVTAVTTNHLKTGEPTPDISCAGWTKKYLTNFKCM